MIKNPEAADDLVQVGSVGEAALGVLRFRVFRSDPMKGTLLCFKWNNIRFSGSTEKPNSALETQRNFKNAGVLFAEKWPKTCIEPSIGSSSIVWQIGPLTGREQPIRQFIDEHPFLRKNGSIRQALFYPLYLPIKSFILDPKTILISGFRSRQLVDRSLFLRTSFRPSLKWFN